MSREAGHHRERMNDDLAAYALGALDQAEAAEVERHLAGCEACSERLRWLRPAVDLLPATVEQRTPPDRLRERLMATVRAEAGAAAAGADGERAGAPALAVPWWRRLGGVALRPAVVLAALLLLVAGIGAGYLLRGSETGGGSTVVRAQPGSDRLAGAVSATLEREGDSATLHVEELPAIDRDEVYEVWVQRGEAVEPGGLFVLDRNGTAQAAVPGPLDDADAVLVTREPSGGSEQPTTAPVLRAAL